MGAQRPPAGLGADRTGALRAVSAELEEQVHFLGEALKARIAHVIELTVARTGRLGIDSRLQRRAARVSTTSTIALARWLAGESPGAARDAGGETWLFYGELAGHREASLNDVITYCLCWRDAVAEVLQQSATELGLSAEALSQALGMLQQGLEFGFVQISKSFDSERRRTDEELAFVATHDALTGLPNRALILDRTEQMLLRARRHQTPVAALFIGLDNFKSINEKLSHGAGDELLRSVAERFDGVVRDTDALGRLGGDEFVVIAEELSLQQGPAPIAERLQQALEAPFALGGAHEARLMVTASIGIASAPRPSAEEFLRDADIAMYQAKWDGKNRYVVFESGMQNAVQSRMELEMDLRDALGSEQFFLVYQPTFNLRDMSPNGVEALIRWKHPTRGIVEPDDFVPLLETTGLIIAVGKWVLEEACHQGATWRRAGHGIGMAVNVSARQLDTDEFVCHVHDALSRSRLDASALTLEITETTLMRNVEETARRLAAIRELGVRIAIDDFGTGYSSLAHLQQFPVDELKIDRSFISRLTENAEGETLVHTLVQLGKALSIETLAEGIEQEGELSALQEEGCDSGQGFLYARPLDAAAVETFLRTWADRVAPASAHAQRGRPRDAVIGRAGGRYGD
jgi:diguanylate cyclase (GGDEF)-like protein